MKFFSRIFRQKLSSNSLLNNRVGDHGLLASIEQRLASADARLESLGRIEAKLTRSSAQIDFLSNHTATYLGDGIALTHLADETPIFINSNDYGSPMNFLSGGHYEEDNLAVLLSFVDEDTVFVDVGANLGFFSLRVAQRLRDGRGHGRVLAFEPQTRVADLLHHTIHINGLRQQVELKRVALSDHAGVADFEVPVGHLGGAHVVTDPTWVHPDGPTEWRKVQLHAFDQIVPSDFKFDLVKIDVEGYELQVLRGMRDTLARSPRAGVLFEKMVRNHGSERGIWTLFDKLGMQIYGVGEAATLVPLTTPEMLIGWDRGYAFATRDPDALLHADRRRFRISPRQLSLGGTCHFSGDGRNAAADIRSSEVLSFGPYWSLPRGHWRLRIEGHADQPIEVIIKARVGQMEIARRRLQLGENTVEFHCDHDLVKFECVLHAVDRRPTQLHLESLRFERIDGTVTPPPPEVFTIETSAAGAPALVIPLPDVPSRSDDARFPPKQPLPRITVFSNCQGEVVASAIQALTGGRMPTIQAVTPLAVEKPELLVEPLREIARHHDLILMQPMVARLVLPLVPDLGTRIELFPSICFSAFHPDLCYVYRQWRSETLDSPLGPYHSSIAYHAWRVGMNLQQTLDHFRDDVYEALHFHDYWDASARALSDEGTAANLPLKGLLDRWRAQGCFMHTHNHPRKQVLIDIAHGLLVRMGIEVPDVDLAGFLHDSLGSDRAWPVYPEIATRLGVAGSYMFKATNGNQQVRTPIRLLDLETFVAHSFEAYDSVNRAALSCDRRFSARYEAVFGEAARQRGRVVVTDHPSSASAHPYAGLPARQFWRSAVAERPIAEVDPVSPRFRFEPSTRIATAGSCFAQNISRALLRRDCGYLVSEPAQEGTDPTEAKSRNYGIYSARYGNLYTARQLLQLLQRATGRFVPAEPAWSRADGRWADPFRPTIEPKGFADIAELEADRTRHLAAVRSMFESLDVFVFTLGLTEAWVSTVDGAVFPLAPGVAAGNHDPAEHVFTNFSMAEVEADLEAFVDALAEINSSARVLFTVSPVPLVATYEDQHILTATTRSKAVLRAAADAVCRNRSQCDYFPAYEIVNGHHTRGSFYTGDMRNVTRSGVDQVMALFFRHYLPSAPAPAPDPELLAEVAILGQLFCDEERLDQPAG